MISKIQALKQFMEQFEVLKESEQNAFARIINKLLQVNYLTLQKNTDADDYRLILVYHELFYFFLKFIDFELEIQKKDEVIFITNENHWNKLKLKKEESLVLLICCLLLHKNKETLGNNVTIEIYLQDIYKELTNIGYIEGQKLTKEKMKQTLMLLKRYNLIDYLDSKEMNDELAIKLYPSLLYVIDFTMAKQYQELLMTH